ARVITSQRRSRGGTAAAREIGKEPDSARLDHRITACNLACDQGSEVAGADASLFSEHHFPHRADACACFHRRAFCPQASFVTSHRRALPRLTRSVQLSKPAVAELGTPGTRPNKLQLTTTNNMTPDGTKVLDSGWN